MQLNTRLSPSHEDYLEAIFFLQKENGWVRVRDISKFLNVKAPSVSGALKTLSKSGLIEYERYGRIELSESGKRRAGRLQKKHDLLAKFLTGVLKVDPDTAEKDACKMEHVISPQTHAKLVTFMQEQDL